MTDRQTDGQMNKITSRQTDSEKRQTNRKADWQTSRRLDLT